MIHRMYNHFETTHKEDLINHLTKLGKNYGKVKEWIRLVHENEFDELVRQLLTIHYDPKYLINDDHNIILNLETDVIDEEAYDELANKIIKYLKI